MTDTLRRIDAAIKELERIQARLGRIQISLLKILTDDTVDEWDEIVQQIVIQLENTQRKIGESQVELLRQFNFQVPVSSGEVADANKTKKTPSLSVSGTPVKDRSDFLDPKDWLKSKQITIRQLREHTGIDEAADRVALYLSDNYKILENFYLSLKRTVNGDRANKWFATKDMPNPDRLKILRFGSMLSDCSFLSEFKYIKANKTILFRPLEDGRVTNFFTGGWLERYSLQVIRRTYRQVMRTWNDSQVLHGAKLMTPDEMDMEFDLILGTHKKQIYWFECKTGSFQNYVTRLRDINQRFLQLSASQASLVLLDNLSDEDKASATALSGLTVLHISELADWFSAALQATERTEG
jgi:hypothetical protein